MKTIELSGKKRPNLGKVFAKKLRRDGQVPCVIYGNGDPVHLTIDHITLTKVFKSPETYIVNLDVEGTKAEVVIKDASFHPVTDHVLHVDFFRFGANEVEVAIPVKLTGTSAGVLAGGKLQLLQRKLKVRGLPANIPDAIEVDITELGLGKTIRVSDLTTEGYEITSPENMGIAMVSVPRSAKEDVAAAAASPAPAAKAAAPAAKKEEKKK